MGMFEIFPPWVGCIHGSTHMIITSTCLCVCSMFALFMCYSQQGGLNSSKLVGWSLGGKLKNYLHTKAIPTKCSVWRIFSSAEVTRQGGKKKRKILQKTNLWPPISWVLKVMEKEKGYMSTEKSMRMLHGEEVNSHCTVCSLAFSQMVRFLPSNWQKKHRGLTTAYSCLSCWIVASTKDSSETPQQ
jgi:hypothetical protein